MDFYGQPRPAYWWCKKAYQLLHPSASYEKLGWAPGETFCAEIWLSSSVYKGGCTVAWELCDLTGKALSAGEQTAAAGAGAAMHVTTVTWAVAQVPHDAFVLRLRVTNAAGKTSRNDYLFGARSEPVLSGLQTLPVTTLEVLKGDGAVTLRNAGALFALGVRLDSDAWLEFSDNYLMIAPGEEVTVQVSDAASVQVTGINPG